MTGFRLRFHSKTIAHLFHPRHSNNHRARVLHPEVLGILSLMMVAFVTTLTALTHISPRTSSILGFASTITPTQVIEQTNQQRAAQGLEPLVFNTALSQAATAKGNDMFQHQYWAHNSPEGTTPWVFIKGAGYSYQVAGENLARDFEDTKTMVSAWMASPTHKANIMNPRYQEIGIAVIDGTLDGYETTLVVQMFGRPTLATLQPDVAGDAVTVESEPVVEVRPTTTLAQADILGEPNQQAVLSNFLVPQGSIVVPPLFTPLQLIKAVFLGLIMMIVLTLTYDSLVIGNRGAMRLVGRNLGHVLLFVVVAFLLISFKAGILG